MASDALKYAASIVAGIGDAAMLFDRDLRVIAYNSAFAQLTGLRRRAIDTHFSSGGSPFELLGSGPEVDRKSALECLATGHVIRLDEVPIRRASGEDLTTIVSFIPVADGEGSTVGVLHCIRDVSAEARMQTRYQALVAIEKARGDELERQVQERTRELTVALAEVTRLSRHDPLTGLLNRRAFTETADGALKLAGRHGRTAAVIMFDLDHFKRLNDTYGHQAGDRMLVECAKALTGALRSTDHLARFGGEEFVALLTETDAEAVPQVAKRCCDAVRAIPTAPITNVASPPQTISVGVAIFPQHGGELDALVSSADRALYYAKEHGRDQVVVYDTALDESSPSKGKSERPRVLILHPNASRARLLAQRLGVDFRVEVATGANELADACRAGDLVAVAVNETIAGGSGVSILEQAAQLAPDAVRLLLQVESGPPITLRGAAAAIVDKVLPEVDADSHLLETMEDALLQRELQRSRLSGTRASPAVANIMQRQVANVIAEEALDFAFQPIVEARTSAIAAYEALCRPRSASIRQPQPLFDAAFQSDQIWELGRLVRRMLAARVVEMPSGTSLFVNLHPTDLEDPQLLVEEPALLACVDRVVFEITERAAIPDFRKCRDLIQRLRELGARFAIDDLGAGYASLNAVALLEPEFLKIDMQLARSIKDGQAAAKLVRRIVEFANDMGIKVIGEGVETRDEASSMRDLGCHLLQGFYFAEPGWQFVKTVKTHAEPLSG